MKNSYQKLGYQLSVKKNSPCDQNDNGAVGKFLITMVIRFYQVSLGRFLGGQCRFVPTCSQYAIEAIKQFGALKGGYMAAKRIAKCHPLGGKGYDPVEKL